MVSSQTAVDSKKEPLDFENRHFPAGARKRRGEVPDTAVVKLHTYNKPTFILIFGSSHSGQIASLHQKPSLTVHNKKP